MSALVNLEQTRASAALKACSQKKKDGTTCITRADVAGFPALIINNGLLAAFAYAIEEGKPTRAGLNAACKATTGYLKESLGIVALRDCIDSKDLIMKLSASPSFDLQRATTESLAFFAYLKRFAAKE